MGSEQFSGNSSEWTHVEVKKKYGKLFEEVSAILYKHDPMGIADLAPADEYDPEAGTLIPRLNGCRSELDVERIVYEEFVRWFGSETAGDRERYDRDREFSGEKCNWKIALTPFLPFLTVPRIT